MTLFEKIHHSALTGTSLTLSPDEVSRTHAALKWARDILESINADDGETEGGNAALSGLDEEDDGMLPEYDIRGGVRGKYAKKVKP